MVGIFCLTITYAAMRITDSNPTAYQQNAYRVKALNRTPVKEELIAQQSVSKEPSSSPEIKPFRSDAEWLEIPYKGTTMWVLQEDDPKMMKRAESCRKAMEHHFALMKEKALERGENYEAPSLESLDDYGKKGMIVIYADPLMLADTSQNQSYFVEGEAREIAAIGQKLSKDSRQLDLASGTEDDFVSASERLLLEGAISYAEFQLINDIGTESEGSSSEDYLKLLEDKASKNSAKGSETQAESFQNIRQALAAYYAVSERK